MIPEFPFDIASIAEQGCVVLGTVVGGVVGVFVMISLVMTGVQWVQAAFTGAIDEEVEDVRIDRTVKVRQMRDDDGGYDYEVGDNRYVNVDWRDKSQGWYQYDNPNRGNW